jgi:murein L,D-transpeptidase YcbB/YkuD
VKAFQKANGLEQTGVADAQTIKKINELAAEASKAAEKEIQ